MYFTNQIEYEYRGMVSIGVLEQLTLSCPDPQPDPQPDPL